MPLYLSSPMLSPTANRPVLPTAKQRIFEGFAAAIVLVVSFVLHAPAARAGTLELQVAALTTLNDLDLSPEQMRALRKLSQGAAGKPIAVNSARLTDDYRAALTSLRDALVADDDEKIADAEDKVDQIRDDEEIDPESDVEMSDSARKVAPEALKILTTSQIAAYLGEHADDVPSPLETMLDALDDCRGTSAADFNGLRSEAADQVALLVAGLDPKAAKPVADKVSEWLDKARTMSDRDFKAKSGELNESARQIVAGYDPVEGLRHWMEGEMADLLSNPQTRWALNARLK